MDKLQNTTTEKGWMDDAPSGRCAATHTVDGPAGPQSVRCDGQAGHADTGHRGTVDGRTVLWGTE
jgi:hypothetical protein